mmetsp:Transcript_7518/g.22229  ORF Transcript_7518/g.22229 Transcript_7518/m.22229 type:complete len:337 (-) Transcript_7518:65-1075(-)
MRFIPLARGRQRVEEMGADKVAAQQEQDCDDGAVTPISAEGSERWSDTRYSLQVVQKPGFFCTIRLAAVLDLSPQETFNLLARPDSHNIFQNITENSYRKILQWRDRAPGREALQVETEAKARWKLGIFNGTFTTRLIVDLDAPKRTIDFQLANQGGLMQAFEGHWTVQPCDESVDLDAIVNSPTDTQTLGALQAEPQRQARPYFQQPSLPEWFTAPWQQPGTAGRPRRSLLTLEQSLMPSIRPPGPLAGLVKGISAAQVRSMLGDLRAEADRINAGAPTPPTGVAGLAGTGLGVEFGFEGCLHGAGAADGGAVHFGDGGAAMVMRCNHWNSLTIF